MTDHDSYRAAPIGFALFLGMGAMLLFSFPPIPQPLSYHHFADQRTWLGIPNFMDVVSNVPFLVIGVWGVLFTSNAKRAFLSPSQRWSYAVFFAGVGLTFFGSCYYHLHPTNARLVWDRLPMALGFMGLLSATIAERVNPRLAERLLLPLIITGSASVGYWSATESLGRGDLRPYLLVQFGSLLAIIAMLALFSTPYADTWCIAVALGFYACAKLFETFDRQILRSLQIVSGHTLKHLAAGAGTCFVLLMLERRASCLPANASSATSHGRQDAPWSAAKAHGAVQSTR